MIKVAVIDIKRNTPKYDKALVEALSQLSDLDVSLFIPNPPSGYFCCNVIPLKQFFKKHVSKVNPILKGLNIIFNYIQLIYLLKKRKYDIVHLQWLALIHKSSFENYIIKRIGKRAKVILTVHNLYPHDLDVDHNSLLAKVYKKRFKKLDDTICHYIVHTDSTRKSLSNEFSININKISVCIHGLFIPEKISLAAQDNRDKFRIRMFGVQCPYKGTDILISAISMMSETIRSKIEVVIAGLSTAYRGTVWKEKAESLGITWIDKLLDEYELDSFIRNADLLVFPYRTISQSGALLLALSYKKLIITSDLPSFKETLNGFTDDMFFQSEDPLSLATILTRCVNHEIDFELQETIMDNLVNEYSWEVSAKQTMNVYKNEMTIKQ